MPLLFPHTIFARFSHDFEATEMTAHKTVMNEKERNDYYEPK